MRALILLCMCALHLGVMAQPYFDRNYCGFAPNDSIDITSDGIPDLVVLGARSGTDDEPSSRGNCILYVMNLPGTSLLNTRDDHGYWRTKACAEGDNIPAVPTRPQDDLRIPLVLYTDGSVRVAYWGYGHHSEPFTVTPNLSTQHYVFHTVANGKAWHGSFTIEPPTHLDRLTIRVGALVPVDRSFTVH